jgi:hypothetical protein
MDSPVIPIALFAVLLASIVGAIPLSASGSGELAVGALGVFTAALAGLAWWVIGSDRRSDPRWQMHRTARRFDARWGKFERDFWAYAAAQGISPSDVIRRSSE